jgi:hypothetical protein
MNDVLDTMADAKAAGRKPHINPLKKAQAQARKRERQGLPPTSTGGSRSGYEVPFDIAVFKHPSRVFTQPWITRDTLQGLAGTSQLRKLRMGKMMALWESLYNLVNGRVQRAPVPRSTQCAHPLPTICSTSCIFQRDCRARHEGTSATQSA